MQENLRSRAASALLWKSLDNIGTKGIFLIRLLVLAALLSPADFGLLAVATTAITLFVAISNFGIEPALIQNSKATDQDYQTGWTINLVRTVVVVTLVTVFAPWIAELFGDQRATAITRVLVIATLIDALASAKVAELNRDLKFRSLAGIHLGNAFMSTVVAIALAPHYGVWAIVFGSLAGSLTATASSYIVAPFWPALAWHPIAARNLMNFGKWVFLAGIVGILANAALRAIISRQLGIAELGIFFLATRLAFLPAEAILGIVGPVAFPIYARLKDTPKLAADTFRISTAALVSILVPSTVLLIILAPPLVDNVLDPRWAGTAPIIQLLALSAILGVVGDAATPMLNGFGKPSKVTTLEAVQAATSLALAWLLAAQLGLPGIALALVLATISSQPLCFRYVQKLAHEPFQGFFTKSLAILGCSLLAALCAHAALVLVPDAAGLLIAGVMGLVIATTTTVAVDSKIDLGIRSLLIGGIRSQLGFKQSAS